jgi:hypothetical protein
VDDYRWDISSNPGAMIGWWWRGDKNPWSIPCDRRKVRLWLAAMFAGSSHLYGLKGIDEWRNGLQSDYEGDTSFLHDTACKWCSSGYDELGDPPMSARADMLRCVFGNPYRLPPFQAKYVQNCPPHCLVGGQGHVSTVETQCGGCRIPWRRTIPWLNDDVVSLARAAYDDRGTDGRLDNARLLVLADALEEAGCPVSYPCEACKGTGWLILAGRVEPASPYSRSARCHACDGTGKAPHPFLLHLRATVDERKKCPCGGDYQPLKKDRLPLLSFCMVCHQDGPFWASLLTQLPHPHVRGCWVVDHVLGY